MPHSSLPASRPTLIARLRNLSTWLGVGALLLVLGLSGCSKAKPAASAPAPDALEADIVAAARRAPGFSGEWEAPIREIAQLYLSDLKDNVARLEKTQRARAAVAKGCRDPFVRYVIFRQQVATVDYPDKAMAREGLALVDEMQQAGYPIYLRTYAANRGYETWARFFGREKEVDTLTRLNKMSWDYTFSCITNPSIPEWVVWPIAVQMAEMWKNEPDKAKRDHVNSMLEQALTSRLGDCATIHYLRGAAAITRAWQARGNGTVSTVSKEGAEIFQQELKAALPELERAWELAPHVDIAESAIAVCMGEGRPVEEMEKWFQRGRSTGQDTSELCDAKHRYLSERWHGTFEQQLAFARECLAHPEYGTSTALLVWRTHYDHRYAAKLPQSYLAQPEVWPEIKQSFNTYFAANPEDRHYRSYYAQHAWVAKDWPVLNEQVAFIDPAFSDLEWMGGLKVYDQMMAVAKRHAGDQAGSK